MKLIICSFTLLLFITNNAFSQVFSCERIKLDPSGFSSQSAAESWFNKNITINADFDKKTATYKGQTSDLKIRHDKKRLTTQFSRKMRSGPNVIVKFVFLANGEVHADLKPVGGYKVPGGGVYRCSGWNGSL